MALYFYLFIYWFERQTPNFQDREVLGKHQKGVLARVRGASGCRAQGLGASWGLHGNDQEKGQASADSLGLDSRDSCSLPMNGTGI